MFNVVPVGEVRRRPSDVSRLVAWGLLLVLLSVTADDRRPWGQTVADAVAAIPDAVQSVLSQVYRWGTFAVVVIAVATAIGRRRWRFAAALALTLAGVAALGLALVDHIDVTTRQVGGSVPYPAVRLAFAVAVVVVSGPHVTRPLRQLLLAIVGVAAVGALTSGDALVIDALGAVALASVLAAGVNLVLGSPAGLPSPSQVRDSLASRGIDVADLQPAPAQVWGQTRYHVVARDGRELTAVVIGRDALDARLFTKVWRSIWYRDAGGSVSFTRIGQVEHHAFVLLLAHERGVPVPELVTAGMGGSRDDAVLVFTRPPGTRLADLAPPPPPRPDDDDGEGDGDREPTPPPVVPYLTEEQLPSATLARAWAALHRLHDAGLAHGRLDGRTVYLGPDGDVTLAEVDRASADAPRSRQDLDHVGLLVATAEVVGNGRGLEAARTALGDEHLARLLPMLSTAALPGVESGRRSWTRQRCKDLRNEGAALLGIDVPEPEELRRVTPTEIVLTVGTLIGVYLLLGQLADLTSVWSTFGSAQIGWVVLAAFATQVPTVAAGVAMIGTVAEQELPLRQTTVIQYSNKFTGLVGGTLAGIAVFTRYLQKRGLGVAVAASSAALTSVAQGFVQAILFVIALLATRGDFGNRIGGSGRSGGGIDVGDVLLVILAAALVIGIALGVPRLRKAIRRVVRPQWQTAKANFKGVIATPRRAALLLGGNLVAQLFFAIGLKLALLAYGYDLPLLDFVVINTVASLLGGIAPVPGGMGVIEAGLIAGLTAAGVPDDAALAATFTYRAFTAYLPPIAGWAALSWLRRTELI